MRRTAPPALLVLALLFRGLPTATAQQAAPPKPSDEQVLKNAGINPTGPGLLDFFRKRGQPVGDLDRVRILVRQLGDKDGDVRDRAAGELVAWGPASIPALRQAANDLDDPNTADRARQCLGNIEGAAASALVTTALHVLGRLHPAGTTAVLLDYLPFAEDDRRADEVVEVLRTTALHDGKADPALTAALHDPVPLRRRVAGDLLVRGGGPEGRAAARPLLRDPRPTVRLHVALALADALDPDAVQVLIDLVGALPEAQARPAEEALAQLAGEWAVRGPGGDDAPAHRLRHDVWTSWWRAVDADALLAEVRKRCLTDDQIVRAGALIRQLRDPSEEVRDRAQAGLLALGSNVVPLVQRAAEGTDPADDRGGLRRCLQAFADQGRTPPLPTAAPRLLALRRPAGAAQALLAYLPLADDALATEIDTALTALAVPGGKLEPALAAALADRLPERRAVAAEVVSRAGTAADRALVRPLLQDKDPSVRLRTALALAGAREREAVPVLIALLAELPEPEAVEAEDYLRQLAGDHAPDVTLGSADASRRKCRDAWAAWWRDQGSKAELPGLEGGGLLHGYTTIVEMWSPNGNGGRVYEVDRAGKVRWTINGLQGPSDAQVLPGDKVLITEQNLQRVIECDFHGKVLWEKSVPNVLRCERLPRGQLLTVCRNEVVVTDRAGKEVLKYTRPGHDILNASRLRNGQIAVFTSGYQYIRLDATGKVARTAQLGALQIVHWNHSVEPLPHDRLLVSEYQSGRVVEQDLNGKVYWQAAVPGPLSASRLANGHTLVCSNNPQRVCELDRKGKVVWEF
jgi:HEAT repeat protein